MTEYTQFTIPQQSKIFNCYTQKFLTCSQKEVKKVLDDWTAEVVGRMHVARITGQMLAAEAGYNSSYVSEVMNGKRGTEKTIQNILDALSRLEGKQAARKEA